jgi:hypothetical protein
MSEPDTAAEVRSAVALATRARLRSRRTRPHCVPALRVCACKVAALGARLVRSETARQRLREAAAAGLAANAELHKELAVRPLRCMRFACVRARALHTR